MGPSFVDQGSLSCVTCTGTYSIDYCWLLSRRSGPYLGERQRVITVRRPDRQGRGTRQRGEMVMESKQRLRAKIAPVSALDSLSASSTSYGMTRYRPDRHALPLPGTLVALEAEDVRHLILHSCIESYRPTRMRLVIRAVTVDVLTSR